MSSVIARVEQEGDMKAVLLGAALLTALVFSPTASAIGGALDPNGSSGAPLIMAPNGYIAGYLATFQGAGDIGVRIDPDG
jgi:hypothetical protein